MQFDSFNENNQTVNLTIPSANGGPAQMAAGPVMPKVKRSSKGVNTIRKSNIKYPFNYLKHKDKHD